MQESRELIRRSEQGGELPAAHNFEVKCVRCDRTHVFAEMTWEEKNHYVHLTDAFLYLAKCKIAYLSRKIVELTVKEMCNISYKGNV